MATILIADDEDVVREVLKSALEKDGYRIWEASNGEEFFRILRDEEIDLVIMDLIMPGKGGLESLMELQSHKPKLKAILLTGAIDTQRRFSGELLRQLGVSLVLQKPFETNQLRDEVRKMLTE